MIFSDKQMHVSRTALAKLEAALDTIRSQSDSPEWVRQIEMDALESQIEDMQADMTRYENLRAGQVEFPRSSQRSYPKIGDQIDMIGGE